jgi:flagellin FlaB
MVLVAAIAAGVLINTAGFLQSQAEATGQESTELVSERIDVAGAVGIVRGDNTQELSEIRVTVSGAPGADEIDLGETTIQALGPGGQENLVFAPGGSVDTDISGSPGDDEIITPAEIEEGSTTVDIQTGSFTDGDAIRVADGAGNEYIDSGVSASTASYTVDFSGQGLNSLTPGDELTIELVDTTNSNAVVNGQSYTASVVTTPVTAVGDLTATEFAVQSDGSFQENPVLGNQDQFTIVLNPGVGALEQTNNPNNAFGQGDSATLDIVSPSSATTQVELNAPDLFSSNNEAVRL